MLSGGRFKSIAGLEGDSLSNLNSTAAEAKEELEAKEAAAKEAAKAAEKAKKLEASRSSSPPCPLPWDRGQVPCS